MHGGIYEWYYCVYKRCGRPHESFEGFTQSPHQEWDKFKFEKVPLDEGNCEIPWIHNIQENLESGEQSGRDKRMAPTQEYKRAIEVLGIHRILQAVSERLFHDISLTELLKNRVKFKWIDKEQFRS